MEVFTELLFVLMNINKTVVRHRNCPFNWIPTGVAKSLQLLHVNAAQARKLFENAGCGHFKALLFFDESAHETPLASFGLKATVNKQQLQFTSIKSKDDTVDCHQMMNLLAIPGHGIYLLMMRHPKTRPAVLFGCPWILTSTFDLPLISSSGIGYATSKKRPVVPPFS